MKNAERFAADRKLPLLLLTAEYGLVDKEDTLPSGGADLSDEQISYKARFVAKQLEEKAIRELHFLVNPSHRLALAYLRLITLACDRAEVTLEVLDYRGRPFADWSKVFRQAEEARKRASKPGVRAKDVFAELFRRYGNEDAMIWFKRGESHRDKGQYADALADFRQSAQLFTILEWRDAANSQAKAAEKHISRGRSLSASAQDELEEIGRLAHDIDVKRLSSEAVRVAVESPSASILLCDAAIERIDKRLNRLPSDLKAKISELRRCVRNDIVHGSLIGGPDQAESFKNLLFDVLKFAYGRRWSR